MRSGAYVIGRGSVGSVLVVIGRDVKETIHWLYVCELVIVQVLGTPPSPHSTLIKAPSKP